MHKKRLWSVLLVLSLITILVPVLAACGKSSTSTPAPTATATVAPTATPTATATPTGTLPVSSVPVKIGGITASTGFGAMAAFLAQPVMDLVQWQVAQQGGINVGGVLHPLQVTLYDSASTTVGAGNAAQLAITRDNVSALVWGGLTGADGYAIADVAKPLNVPFFHYEGENALNDNYPNTIGSTLDMTVNINDPARFVLDVLKPKTAAYYSWDGTMDRSITAGVKKILEAAGVKTVYEDYHAPDTTDFTAALTKIKAANPDVVISWTNQAVYMSIDKQIMSIGGWGNIKFFGIAQAYPTQWTAPDPGANGQYGSAYWVADSTIPGPKAFQDAWASYAASHPDWAKKYGSVPDNVHVPFYQPLWLAIKAIELAGSTDPAAITKAARSGNLVWDTAPCGVMSITANGYPSAHPIIVQDVNGKWVFVKQYTN